jgi:hypothetical protein
MDFLPEPVIRALHERWSIGYSLPGLFAPRLQRAGLRKVVERLAERYQ